MQYIVIDLNRYEKASGNRGWKKFYPPSKVAFAGNTTDRAGTRIQKLHQNTKYRVKAVVAVRC